MTASESGDSLSIFSFSDWRSQSIEDLYSIVEHLDKDIDLILYAGDDIGRFVNINRNHFHKLAQVADADLGYVLGNDDRPHHLRHFQIETDRVYDLHRNPIQKDGIVFIGQEGDVGEPAMGYIQYDEQEAQSHLSDLYDAYGSSDTVLVSHTPPFGTLDYAQRHSEQRIGSKAVRDFSREIEPRFVLTGHVHQFGGQTAQTEFGPVVNIASHDFMESDGRIGILEIPLTKNRDIDITHTTISDLWFELDGITGAENTKAELTKLTQVGNSRAETLQENGVQTITQIASQGQSLLTETCGIATYSANIIYNHAKAYERGEPIVTDQTEFTQIRDQNPILVDVETNLAQDRVWCIGAYDYITDSFDQFVDLDDEDALINDFGAYLADKATPEIVSYSCTNFDQNQLLDAAERHEKQIDKHVGGWTDLCSVVRETMFIPERSRSLDNIARAVGYEFEHPGVTGLEIGSAYSAYLSEGEVPEGGWKEYLEYNLDDTIAMKQIIDTVSEYGGTINSASITGFEDYNISEDWQDMSSEPTSSSSDSSQEKSEEDQSFTVTYDVSEILNSVSAKAEWNEKNPLRYDLAPTPRCERCGEPLPDSEQRVRKDAFQVDGFRYRCEGTCEFGPSDDYQNPPDIGETESGEYACVNCGDKYEDTDQLQMVSGRYVCKDTCSDPPYVCSLCDAEYDDMEDLIRLLGDLVCADGHSESTSSSSDDDHSTSESGNSHRHEGVENQTYECEICLTEHTSEEKITYKDTMRVCKEGCDGVQKCYLCDAIRPNSELNIKQVSGRTIASCEEGCHETKQCDECGRIRPAPNITITESPQGETIICKEGCD